MQNFKAFMLNLLQNQAFITAALTAFSIAVGAALGMNSEQLLQLLLALFGAVTFKNAHDIGKVKADAENLRHLR